MKITETITRECCEPVDYRAVDGSPLMDNGHPMWRFCRHCGHRQRATVYENAEWLYQDDPLPWSKAKDA